MRRFGELEAVIMDRLWERGRPTLVREMVEDLREDRALAYTTVMTVLDRMARKDLVVRERDGRAWTYRPAQSRGEMTAEVMRLALGEISEETKAGDREAALVAFVGEASEADRQALRDALAALESTPER